MTLFHISRPDIRDRLRYNILPSETERETIRESIATARAHLRATECNPCTSKNQEAVLSQYIAEYTSLLAPIRRLSVDILLIIFLDHGIHTPTPGGPSLPSLVEVYKPNLLAAVSRRWQDIVWGTAEFWTALTIPVSQTQSKYPLERLQLCLERSKDALLSLKFHKAHDTLHQGVLAEIFLHAERWVDVALPLDASFLMHLSPVRSRLVRLETLRLGEVTGIPYHSAGEVSVFKDVPRLRFLRLDTSFHTISTLPSLPWTQLEGVSLHLGGQNHHLHSEILSVTPELREISIFSSVDVPEQVLAPRRQGYNLRKLVLVGEYHSLGIPTRCLDLISHPTLNEMHVFRCPWDPLRIESLIRRSGCHLGKLVLQGTRPRNAELVEIFRLMPTLHTLVLKDLIPTAITNLVVESLTLAPGLPQALPALTTLILTGTYFFKTDKLLTMLASRMMPHNRASTLLVVDLTFPDRLFNDSNFEEFGQLEGDSLSLLCLDNARGPTQMFFGTQPRRNWRGYTEDGDGRQTQAHRYDAVSFAS
ncbi:hypothetical protein B0H16DRAFT_1838150 [Mycena metata]|uniref:F-box domain-containing protein n=1 Tax=Mycena metata TaxID=1033252 RepID=A0AAD7NXH9_9AGAR|nr:hypothetical protein B0H16DRAFT_1838150 [Mycena metata]